VCSDEIDLSDAELLQLVGDDYSDNDYAVMRRHYREMIQQTPWYKEQIANAPKPGDGKKYNLNEIVTAEQDLYGDELSMALFTKLEQFIDEIQTWESNPYLNSIGENGCICGALETDICTVWCGCTPDMVRARENTLSTKREPLTCHFKKCYDEVAHGTEIRYECGCYDRGCDDECSRDDLVEGKDYVMRSYKEYLPSYFETEEDYQEYLRR